MGPYEFKPIEKSIAPGCPWAEAQDYYGTPNVDWCEPTVCSFISEPANTWSNLPFVLVGVFIWWVFKKKASKHFGIVVVLMGFFSGIYHATNNALTQNLDFLGILLMTSFILASQSVRLFSRQAIFQWGHFWFFTTINSMLFHSLGLFKIPMQAFMLINAVPIFILEIVLFFKYKNSKVIPNFLVCVAVLVAAQVCAQIDLRRIYCDQNNIFLHGHVLWHILCATSMYFAARHIENTLRP